MSTQPSPATALLAQMITGFRVSQLIHVAAALGIADLLRDGPRSSDELAQAAGAHPRALYRTLRALASLGVFAETTDGRFELTPLAAPLRTDVAGSLRAYAMMYGGPSFWRAHGALLHSVRTNETGFDHVHGVPLFEYLRRHPDAAEVFNAAMRGRTVTDAAAIAAAYDFSGIATLVDVGGGHGALLAAVLKAHPRMRGILFDLPEVLEGARDIVASQGLADRCALAAGDFFEAVPGGGDAYALKYIVHDWDDERALAVLANCRRAMADGARLLLVEQVIPPGNAPSPGKLLDITMLAVTGGCERTEAEYRALLGAAGFRLAKIVPTEGPLSIIEAVPV